MLYYIDWKGGSEQEAICEYFVWLNSIVGFREEYEPLLNYIFSIEFTWTDRVKMDRNRARDGIALRERWMYEEQIRGDIFYDIDPRREHCSVFEMLVALSDRVENDILGDQKLGLFWRFLENLGALDAPEEAWNEIFERWLERKFGRNGAGSITPLWKNERISDQRRVEIWGQVMAYLDEI